VAQLAVIEVGAESLFYPQSGNAMLTYAILFLFTALVAGFLGFGVVAGAAATLAKVLFLIFLVLFVFSLLCSPKRDDFKMRSDDW
jgi:uncharacterized membrane protein YtjA (UPF0391 family)